MKNLKVTPFIIGIAILVFASSCYDDVYLDERDTTLSYYDNERDFDKYNTYVVRDCVGIITDHLTDKQIERFYAPGGFNDKLKERITSELENIGYVQVDSLEDSDFAVNMAVAVVENTVLYPGYWWDYYYWGYWGWYGSYYPQWGAYYNYWYPWYYPIYSYSYDVGTLLIEFVDSDSLEDYQEFMDTHTKEEIENMDPTNPDLPKLDFFWQSIVRGIMSTSTEYNEDRINSGIDEAFEQSPYLKK